MYNDLKNKIQWFNKTIDEPYVFSFSNQNGEAEVELIGIREQMIVQLAWCMDQEPEVFDFLKEAVSLLERTRNMEN